jgi:nucleoside-diphosphate-sugar epimerase
MRILFTGASSFTGYWFVKSLHSIGHDLTCTFTAANKGDYTGLRKVRIDEIEKIATCSYNVKFGDDNFIKLAKENKYDLVCHHAADVTNYKEIGFNTIAALENNTNNIFDVFNILSSNNCIGIILTGSVFEAGEGAGSDNLPNFSPYGLSKTLTSQVFDFYTKHFGLKFGKFVIPNPFGQFEEPRFTSYLINNWLQNKTPTVNTPLYIRDNIHVRLLSDYYTYFVNEVYNSNLVSLKINPSGYIESQGSFTLRLANAMRKRLNKPCEFELNKQTSFSEPLFRANTSFIKSIYDQFNEESAWDELAEFYKNNQ